MEAVVSLLYNSNFAGSGFVCYTSPQAFLVMTCQHVVGAKRSLGVAFPGQTKSYPAKVLGSDHRVDLALLRFTPDAECMGCAALRFAEPGSTPLNCGEVVMMAFYCTTPGRLLYPEEFPGKITAELKDGRLTCDYTSENGTSGGAVLKGGAVVGVNRGHYGAARSAVSVETVITTLRGWLYNPGNIGADAILRRHAES